MRDILTTHVGSLPRGNELTPLLLAHDERELPAQLGELRQGERGLAGDMAAESRQPLLDVGRVSDLAELAIAHDRDPGGFLLRHRILDGGLHQPLEGHRVMRLAVIPGEQQRYQLLAARQAADVRCQDLPHPPPYCLL